MAPAVRQPGIVAGGLPVAAWKKQRLRRLRARGGLTRVEYVVRISFAVSCLVSPHHDPQSLSGRRAARLSLTAVHVECLLALLRIWRLRRLGLGLQPGHELCAFATLLLHLSAGVLRSVHYGPPLWREPVCVVSRHGADHLRARR